MHKVVVTLTDFTTLLRLSTIDVHPGYYKILPPILTNSTLGIIAHHG
jgi:hypothetical protein